MGISVVKVESLSKKFIIGHEVEAKHTTFREAVTNSIGRLFRRNSVTQNSREEFWALKDVNFEIHQGDRVGIIGRNGAGKSTLLKILSRISDPSSGRITLKGRVASLLEVGTGFHPELTGRENVFLNGAILGMSRSEIKNKFDEIVTFAEIERFLDTPVKRYSSGMYVRLAFAVAAHLDPEILIVDEVLAVGDAQFQKKCLGKMEDVSRNEGRTILFVSHNMRVVQNLCETVLVFDKGKMVYNGEKTNGLIYYSRLNQGELKLADGANVKDHIASFALFGGNEKHSFASGSELKIEVGIFAEEFVKDVYLNVCFDTPDGIRIAHIRNDWSYGMISLETGLNRIKINIDNLNISPGIYDVWIRVYYKDSNQIIDSNLHSIEITGNEMSGFVSLDSKWYVEKTS